MTEQVHAQIDTLATFGSGTYPGSDLTFSADGSTLYGTTFYGGTNSDGTVFSLPTGVVRPTR